VLDMNIHNCACFSIIVPEDSFGAVYSSFSHYGFYELNLRPETGMPATIIINIESNPPGMNKRVCLPQQWN
ncbi:MAG: hypothetical protein ACRD3W_32505, partial [Terriglobales bacterium]